VYSISVLLQTADAIWYTYLEGSNNLVCVSVLYLLHVGLFSVLLLSS